MPKTVVALTLDKSNFLWLKGRAQMEARGSVSEVVDRLIREARTGQLLAADVRPVVTAAPTLQKKQ
jgi:hypothetical protein